jgi:hypothetical protein
VSQEAAERAAVRAMPGRAVRETVLTDLSDTHAVPAIHALTWAVSLTVPPGSRPPSAGPPPGHPGMEPSYLVVFIDARWGRSSWPPATDDSSPARTAAAGNEPSVIDAHVRRLHREDREAAGLLKRTPGADPA